MPDLPYTAADLRHEAARQHYDLTEDPDCMSVGDAMWDTHIKSTVTADGGTTWSHLRERDGDAFGAAQLAIHDLITGAADVSEWAITLGAAGLTPHEPHAIHSTTGEWDVAVQVATTGQLTDTARDELLTAIRQAVLEAYCRVLHCKPA